ncbi:hypothetical protein BN1708_002051 [Verticillium longisporum]|uniref:SGNH hydrolase-type esterase domain-containing protein n=1 Tax=Verticillium longisporum TaxID=100787 RepID=A0A0G4KHH4_VERLO|nr:hypothetical protein BN1708_002051 [Verticillium longisporum]
MPSPRLRHGLVWVTALAAGMASLVAGQSLPDLRIMPLGDSITKGSGSSDNNGYRNRLRQKLTTQGTDREISVDMIGSMWHGTMADNDHEGHSGEYLRQIRTYLQRSIQARPNVVLVHAGTNNMDKEVDLGEAPALIEGIIDDLLQGSPNTVVLVAPVIWANDARMNANTDRFNKQLTTLIASKQKAGEHVLAVPITIGAGDLSDRKHPNNAGYGKMADAWFNAILEAHERGWIKAPTKVNADELSGMGLGWEDAPAGAGSAGCGGRNFESKGQVFDGFRVWEEVGTIRGPVENGRRNKVILADLNGDGISDYVVADDDGTVRAWINGGKPNQWTSIGKINPDWSTITGDMGPVRYADLNGDGKDDYLVVFGSGIVHAYINSCDWRAPVPVGGGEGDEIDGDSTCEDIKKHDSGVGIFDRPLWNDAETTPYWSWWLSFDSNANDGVPRAFASEWGFDSVSCPILGDCGFPNDCSGYSKSKGSGRAHLIMKSLDNLHSYYKAMYQAVSSTLGYFNAMQRVFEDYYPEPSLEDVGIKALLQMTEHILGVGTAMAGSDTGELIANGLFSTVSGVAENALENKDEPLRYAADLAKVGFRYFNNSAAAIETMHNTLLKQGHYDGPDGAKIILDDVFKNGAWLNSDKIPILSQSEKDGVPRIGTSELASWFFAFLHASILNYSWRNSLVFIVGHKMTRKEFDDGAADIDDNLKAYHDGRGYFLQSYEPYRSLGSWEFRSRDAPGYNIFPEGNGLTFRLKHSDAIISSVETHNVFGFNYTGSVVLDEILTKPNWDTWRDLKPDLPGTFSIPVGLVDEAEDWNSGVEYFLTRINDPGEGPHDGTLFCECKNNEDKNGKRFIDQLRYADDLKRACSTSWDPTEGTD